MKFKITLMLLLIASMLKAQETRIVFNAPASTPADATVTLMIWTAIEYEPGQWMGFGDDYTGDLRPETYQLEKESDGVYSLTLESAVLGQHAAGYMSNYIGMRFYMNGDPTNLAMFRNLSGDIYTDDWPSYKDVYDDGGNVVGEGLIEGKEYTVDAVYWKSEAQSYEVTYNVTVPSNTPDDLVIYIWGAKFGYGLDDSNRMTKKADGTWTLTASYYEQPTAFYTYVMNYEEIMEGDITISERNADENDDSNVDRVVPAGPAVLNDVVARWEGYPYVGTGIDSPKINDLGVFVAGNTIVINSQDNVVVTVYNLEGKIILTAAGTNEVINNIASGSYIVKVSNATQSLSQKIVIR